MSEILGTVKTNVTAKFQRGIYPIARTLMATKDDLAVVFDLGGGGRYGRKEIRQPERI